ncbi:solute carrier family 22 member 7-like [Dermacentor andersoni]|uniref:solute carrier family 22 member 7-like n=1 Tax=Dermacentor andersoni TaxID=34620 RepID=UPI002416D2CC|nr:solute carrier family 22 member 7-like [Dermacentor andersoni]
MESGAKVGTGEAASQPRSILGGFVTSSDARAIIQENVYVILGHGKFQRRVLLCAVLCLTVLVLHAFAYRLIGRPVQHWCRPPDEFLHVPVQEWKNVAIPVLADGSLSQCTVYDPPVLGENASERRVVSCNQWEYAADRQEDSIVSAWDLVCGRHWLYALSSSAYMIGSMVFVPLAGVLSDRHGRRPTILACSFTMLFACLATGSSQVFSVFLVIRCLVAGTSSATYMLVFIVLYEVTGNEHRALYSLLAASVGPALVLPLMSIVSMASPRWWLSQAFLATVSAMAAACCYMVEESPVWLVDTHRVRLAERVVLYAAAQNGIDLAKAKGTFKALKQQLEKREAASPTTTTISASVSTRSRRAASVLISWFGASFAFYGTGLRETALDSLWAVSALMLQVILLVVVYNGITKWGQRVTLSMVLALLCVSITLHSALHHLNVTFPWIVLARLVVDSSAAVAMAVNCSYTTEVFPTSIRSRGLCVSYSVGRAGALLATFLNSMFSDETLVFDIIMTLLVFASGMAIQWLPEIFVHKKTQSPTLEPAAMTEEQRKEALKASLGQGTEAVAKKAKRRKSQRSSTCGATSPDLQAPPDTVSRMAEVGESSKYVSSTKNVKHSKAKKSARSSGAAFSPSRGPTSR